MTHAPIWQPDRRAPGGGYWVYPAPPPASEPAPFDTRPPYVTPQSAALKNGFRTSEFWVTVLAIVAPPLLDYIGPAVATIAGPWGVVAAGAYALARGAIKFATVFQRRPVTPPPGWAVPGAPPFVPNYTPPRESQPPPPPDAYAGDEEAVAAGWPGGKGI